MIRSGVMKKIKGYISSEELKKILLLVDNAQDRFLIMAVYNGIAGKNNMSELLSLKVEDVNFKNKTIKTIDKIVHMDSALEKATREAIEQKIYYTESKGNVNNNEEIEFNMDSPYIVKVRPMATNKNGLEPMKYGGFRTRFVTLRRTGLDVSASELETSGIVNGLLAEKEDWTVLEVDFALRMKNIKANAYRIYSIIKEVTE